MQQDKIVPDFHLTAVQIRILPLAQKYRLSAPLMTSLVSFSEKEMIKTDWKSKVYD